MGSVGKDGNGWRIRFYDGSGVCQQIRVSGISKAKAVAINVHVTELNAANISGISVDRPTAAWLGKIGDVLHAKLVAAGLCESRTKAPKKTLVEAIQHHIGRGRTKAGRPASESTLKKWKASHKHLAEFFGDRLIDAITVEDAENFRDWLSLKRVGKTGKLFAENNVRTVIACAKVFFNAAKRRKWIVDNPFEHEVSEIEENRTRSEYVPPEIIAKVMKSCPDDQWKLMLALWRFAGLRKMEVFELRWEHVQWDVRTMVVHAPKTSRQRLVPIAAILPYLEAVKATASRSDPAIISRYSKPLTNLDKPFKLIIRQAGVTPWLKPFQNLRASCETDWLDWVGPKGERISSHVVAAWIGHSVKVQAKHYAQVDQHHFDAFNDATGHSTGHEDDCKE